MSVRPCLCCRACDYPENQREGLCAGCYALKDEPEFAAIIAHERARLPAYRAHERRRLKFNRELRDEWRAWENRVRPLRWRLWVDRTEGPGWLRMLAACAWLRGGIVAEEALG